MYRGLNFIDNGDDAKYILNAKPNYFAWNIPDFTFERQTSTFSIQDFCPKEFYTAMHSRKSNSFTLSLHLFGKENKNNFENGFKFEKSSLSNDRK